MDQQHWRERDRLELEVRSEDAHTGPGREAVLTFGDVEANRVALDEGRRARVQAIGDTPVVARKESASGVEPRAVVQARFVPAPLVGPPVACGTPGVVTLTPTVDLDALRCVSLARVSRER